MRKVLFIVMSLMCVFLISSPVCALTTGYFDYAEFLAALGSVPLVVDDFESAPWPPAYSTKTQPTVSMGVSWTAAEDLVASGAAALSGAISISSVDQAPNVADELNASLPAGVFAVGGFVDNFGFGAQSIAMTAFDATDNPILQVAYIGVVGTTTDIDWGFLGIITDETSIARVQFKTFAAVNEPDDFVLDNFQFASAVPEPSTILLLSFGLAGVGLFRRRFKN